MEALDFGTPELHRHRKVQLKNGKATVSHQTPIDFYRDKMIISDEQWMAGDRLAYLFTASNVFRLRTSEISDMPKGRMLYTDLTPSENAYIEYKDASEIIHRSIRKLILDVCCYNSRTHHIGALREGLNDLVRHFGFKRSWISQT